MLTGDGDPAVRLAWKRERREAIRRFHPDRGGSPADLMRALAEVDQKFGAGSVEESGPRSGSGVTVTHSRTYLIRLSAHRLRVLVAVARGQLPPHWPGSRRYSRL